jgi:hypothetical protein
VRLLPAALCLPPIALAVLGIVLREWPDEVEPWLAKEGAVEHVGHALLLAAVALFGYLARTRRWTLVVACFLALVLGEEIDWGGVYGPFRGDNVHNAWGGHSYVLFGVPVAIYFGAPLIPRARARFERRLGTATATPRESACAAAVAAIAVSGSLFLGEHEPAFDEASELALYCVFALAGARAVVERSRDRRSRSLEDR